MNPPPFVLKFDDKQAPQATPATIGGKGWSLIKMFHAGLPVPSGFVLTTGAFDAYRRKGLKSDPQLMEGILTAFDELGSERVAVRSSAVSEDSETASWAGQFETLLNVVREDLLAAIEKCWQSIDQTQDYAAASLQPAKDDSRLAVVVQSMIDSQAAGVAFSVNPVTKNQNEIMIEATYGLGEMLVQGMVTPDQFLVDKAKMMISQKQISPKKEIYVYKDGSNQIIPVDANKIHMQSINDKDVLKIARLIRSLEEYLGHPQDIEWALAQAQLYLLQARPITTM